MEWSAIIRSPKFAGNDALTTGKWTHFEVVDGTESLLGMQTSGRFIVQGAAISSSAAASAGTNVGSPPASSHAFRFLLNAV
jgi:hypothetical protein